MFEQDPTYFEKFHGHPPGAEAQSLMTALRGAAQAALARRRALIEARLALNGGGGAVPAI